MRNDVPARGDLFVIQHSIFSILFGLICLLLAGPSLSLFFGGFFITAFLAPSAVINWKSLTSVVAGVALVWLIPLFQTSDTLGQWLQLTITLASFAFALAAITSSLERIHVHPIFASAAATLIALAWLSWPIWLSPQFSHLSDRLIDRLVSVHPPLVANGVLTNEPPWTERSLAYRLTRLNQDTPIHLPTAIWPCVAVNLSIGAALLAFSCGIRRFLPHRPA